MVFTRPDVTATGKPSSARRARAKAGACAVRPPRGISTTGPSRRRAPRATCSRRWAASAAGVRSPAACSTRPSAVRCTAAVSQPVNFGRTSTSRSRASGSRGGRYQPVCVGTPPPGSSPSARACSSGTASSTAPGRSWSSRNGVAAEPSGRRSIPARRSTGARWPPGVHARNSSVDRTVARTSTYGPVTLHAEARLCPTTWSFCRRVAVRRCTRRSGARRAVVASGRAEPGPASRAYPPPSRATSTADRTVERVLSSVMAHCCSSIFAVVRPTTAGSPSRQRSRTRPVTSRTVPWPDPRACSSPSPASGRGLPSRVAGSSSVPSAACRSEGAPSSRRRPAGTPGASSAAASTPA